MKFGERIATEIEVEIEKRVKKLLSMIRLHKREGEETNIEARGYNKAVNEQNANIQRFLNDTQTQHTAGNFHVNGKMALKNSLPDR